MLKRRLDNRLQGLVLATWAEKSAELCFLLKHYFLFLVAFSTIASVVAGSNFYLRIPMPINACPCLKPPLHLLLSHNSWQILFHT